MNERWVHIPGYDGYYVSDLGNIKSDRSDSDLSPTVNQQGHLKVNLMRHGLCVTRSVSHLVARSFLDRPERPDFNSLIHHDGNKLNCAASNLAWRPRHFVLKYHKQFETRAFAKAAHLAVMDLETREVHASVQELAIQQGLLVNDILVSSYARTYVWPTYQRFQVIED